MTNSITLTMGIGSKGEPLSGSAFPVSEYKWIKGWENTYAVTPDGKILSRRYSRSNGPNWRALKQVNCEGYRRVTLARSGKRQNCQVHRAVALAFLEPDPNRPSVNHRNSIRSDNRVENLEWVTARENVEHSVKLGRHVHAATHPMAKYTKAEVEMVRVLRASGAHYGDIVRRVGMSKSQVARIVRFQNWKEAEA